MHILDTVVFYTNNIPAVVEFYTNKMGLKLDYRQGDTYASFLFDNNVRLGIKKASEEREIPGTQAFFFTSKDAKADYEDAKARGLEIYKELTDEPWAVEFSVLDPDGNKIEYLQRK